MEIAHGSFLLFLRNNSLVRMNMEGPLVSIEYIWLNVVVQN